ncbi:hypothetical protein BV25DRAFT_344013 [Artomyces pyxidatus]|uniref:Uncharacterized protein n=1 Tax=Artomyces pyxidatus TaxID=48021 RepID=A0ACB8T7L3_9AGAM|nr:hypothetical protein BV25DRAFT_344013 [Artomyces pyxidatus]
MTPSHSLARLPPYFMAFCQPTALGILPSNATAERDSQEDESLVLDFGSSWLRQKPCPNLENIVGLGLLSRKARGTALLPLGRDNGATRPHKKGGGREEVALCWAMEILKAKEAEAEDLRREKSEILFESEELRQAYRRLKVEREDAMKRAVLEVEELEHARDTIVALKERADFDKKQLRLVIEQNKRLEDELEESIARERATKVALEELESQLQVRREFIVVSPC